jgi:predicted nucleotidyltransferase
MQLAELKRQTLQIQALLARFGATDVAVFGSVANYRASADSVVDLLVDLPDSTSLFDRSELKSALEKLLLTRVDLIRRRNFKPAIKAIVEAERLLFDGPERSSGAGRLRDGSGARPGLSDSRLSNTAANNLSPRCCDARCTDPCLRPD